MKKLLIALPLIAGLTKANAQTTGTLMFGANALNSSLYNSGNTYTVQNFQARVGYFVSDHLAVGLCLETGLNNNKAVPFGLTLMTRYYTGNKGRQLFKAFAEAGAGFADNMLADNTSMADNMGIVTPQNSLQGTACLGAGISIFPAAWIALDAGPEYRYVTGRNSVHRLGASAGIKFFFGESSFKKALPDKFNSLY